MNGQYQCYFLETGVLKHPALSTGGNSVTARVNVTYTEQNIMLSQLIYARVLLSSYRALKITRHVMYLQQNFEAHACNHGC